MALNSLSTWIIEEAYLFILLVKTERGAGSAIQSHDVVKTFTTIAPLLNWKDQTNMEVKLIFTLRAYIKETNKRNKQNNQNRHLTLTDSPKTVTSTNKQRGSNLPQTMNKHARQVILD